MMTSNPTRHSRGKTACPVVVVSLGDRWRVIEGPDADQWIVQKRAGYRHGRERWDNRGYFRAREALKAFLRALPVETGEAVLAILDGLPEQKGAGDE